MGRAIFASVLIRGVQVHQMFHLNEAGLRQLVSQFVSFQNYLRKI